MNKNEKSDAILAISANLDRMKREYNRTLDKQLARHIKYHTRQLRALMERPS